jgi:hypothetical protein
MTVFNALTFAKYTAPTTADPVTKRRNKLLEKIDEQILLATDDTYTPTKRVNTTDSDGNTRVIEKPKRAETIRRKAQTSYLQLQSCRGLQQQRQALYSKEVLQQE